MNATARPPRPTRVALATFAAAVSLFIATPANFLDPFAGFDDYPTLFGWLDAYYGKTLSEGRWVNFLWQYAVGPINRYAAFYFVAFGWCAVCAIIAASVFRDDRLPWRAALFAVALAVAPPFAVLIAWSNTLVPVLVTLLAYVAIAAWARPGVAVAAMLVFAPLGLMTYTSSPMIMALALALCGDWRGFRRGAGLVGLLAAGVALGLLTIYLANWRVHGVFGVVADAWREPTPVSNVEDLRENVGRAAERFRGNILALVHPAVWVGLVAFFATPFLAYAVIPRRSLPVLAVLGAGMGLLILTFLMTGVGVNTRAWAFAWMAVAALFALMAREAKGRVAAGGFLGVLILMSLGGGYFWREFHGRVTPFQTETADLADRIAKTAPGDTPILVYGPAHGNPAIFHVHNRDWARDWSLAFRIHALTGRESCICGVPLGRSAQGYCEKAATEALCASGAEGAETLEASDGNPAVGVGPGGVALVRFPD